MSSRTKDFPQATYNCDNCEREWDGDLPPLWSGMDLWPVCCDVYAQLVEPIEMAEPAA